MRKENRGREVDQSFVKPELSITECKKILCCNGKQYTDEEVKEIRALILNFVEIDYLFYMRCKEKQAQTKVIDLAASINNENETYSQAA